MKLVPQLVVAKNGCKPDNGGFQVLCKTPAVASSTLAFSSLTLGASSTYEVPKNPLRLIVSRSSHFEDFYDDGTLRLAYFLDTLECGHQQITYLVGMTEGVKRHRCPECGQAQVLALPPKKPAASAPAPKITRRAA